MDDISQVIVPDDGSQLRLRVCPECKSDNVAYVRRSDSGNWHGRCFDCGYVGPGALVRHDAQGAWNEQKGVAC